MKIHFTAAGVSALLAISLVLPSFAMKKSDADLPPQLAIGAVAPAFALVNTVGGDTVRLADYVGKSKAVCVVWFCDHCPVAKANEGRILDLAREFQPQGVQFLLISSNDTTGNAIDGPDEMKMRAITDKFPCPYLFDPSQEVGKAYGARVTPHIFLLDKDLVLRYRGSVDDNSRDASAATAHYLRDALTALVAGKAADIKTPMTIAKGCSIMWKD